MLRLDKDDRGGGGSDLGFESAVVALSGILQFLCAFNFSESALWLLDVSGRVRAVPGSGRAVLRRSPSVRVRQLAWVNLGQGGELVRVACF